MNHSDFQKPHKKASTSAIRNPFFAIQPVNTMTNSLSLMVDKYGLEEVLDRITWLAYEKSDREEDTNLEDHWSGLICLLEEVTHKALVIRSLTLNRENAWTQEPVVQLEGDQ